MGESRHFCTQCGQELRPGAQFCTKCGHTVTVNEAPIRITSEGGDGDGLGSEATTTMPAGADRAAFYRSWPGTESARPPTDEIGTAVPESEAGGYASLPPPGADDPPSRLGRPRRRPLIGLAALVVVGLAVVAVLVLRPAGQRTPARSAAATAPALATTSPPASASSSSAPSSLPAQQQAAQNLATLLARSVTDRHSVNDAYNDALRCGGRLQHDTSTFQEAVTSRRQLLRDLAAMPLRSALPQSMLRKLKSAWQVSIKADQDFAGWAQDRLSGGCAGSNQSDPFYRAANGPDLQATADKDAFTGMWDPLAAQYNLTQYAPDRL
jgi:hypothetical protein